MATAIFRLLAGYLDQRSSHKRNGSFVSLLTRNLGFSRLIASPLLMAIDDPNFGQACLHQQSAGGFAKVHLAVIGFASS
ncbi:MAG: hypothetical protein II336_15680 [Loktanella sp.]|nr:hypothetical protein [Loktanella sp.]